MAFRQGVCARHPICRSEHCAHRVSTIARVKKVQLLSVNVHFLQVEGTPFGVPHDGRPAVKNLRGMRIRKWEHRVAIMVASMCRIAPIDRESRYPQHTWTLCRFGSAFTQWVCTRSIFRSLYTRRASAWLRSLRAASAPAQSSPMGHLRSMAEGCGDGPPSGHGFRRSVSGPGDFANDNSLRTVRPDAVKRGVKSRFPTASDRRSFQRDFGRLSRGHPAIGLLRGFA
ncbi:hypothetical protein SAMN02745824_3457 [Parasphingorhabdus marina DSM 22363]|uniref:Uncharacterized protein n=1 Tax=Parasphingorhabdus marina DSM 22363 TaxID=1123272 RepID=A0A1N6HTY2_9SPHN|nr:hypothetical protein SAMN02745824_3457 [Parasphingorhabdus marina DSM 22363]